MTDDYDIGKAFQAIENELIASMIRNMKDHKLEEIDENRQWTMWQAEQLKALEKYKQDNRKKYAGQFKDINSKIEALIIHSRAEGNMQQELTILKAIREGFKGAKRTSAGGTAEFFRLNDRKLDALIKATTNDMKKAETAVLRMADDQYRKSIFNAQVYANTGAGTYEKAVDMAVKDMLASGLNCVEYKNGARHTLADYADMAIRTASKRAYLQGEGEKRQEWGISTVIMNKRGNPCPQCLPFVGKVLIDDVYSGGAKDGKSSVTGLKYPLMSEAIASGLYHPRCKDSHTTYFEGISTPPNDAKYTKEELDQMAENYRKEQQLQYAKRQQEKFGRLAENSLDEDNRRHYQQREQEWSRKVMNQVSEWSEEFLDKSKKSVAKDVVFGIIKTNKARLKMDLQLFANGKERADIYSSNWSNASLKEAIEKFAPGATGIKKSDKGKIIYQSSDGEHSVVYDYNGNYFRIEDHRKKGKRRYVDMNGNDVANITENGKTRGRTKDEYESITHFNNSDT